MIDSPGPPTIAASDLASELQWRRLDARMLLVSPVLQLIRFLPVLFGVFLIGRSTSGVAWWQLVVVAVPIGYGVLEYVATSFRIGAVRLELRHGLVKRTELTAPLDRIRAVEVTASPIHRVLGLAKVEIGTAETSDRSERLILDSLPLQQARALRTELLHRSNRGTSGAAGAAAYGTASTAGVSSAGGAGGASGGIDAADSDEILLRFDPRWVRFAPLTTAGLAIAGAAAAVAGRFSNKWIDIVIARAELAARAPVSEWLLVSAAVLLALIVISLLAVAGYLLSYWGFTVRRDRAGQSFQISRGLATSRETNLESARLRGVELHEPAGLRLVGAARLSAMVTGMVQRDSDSVPIVPPAPRRMSIQLGAAVLAAIGSTDSNPLSTDLVGHGRRARQRRYLRAGQASVAVMLVWGALVLWLGWSPYLLLVTILAPTLAMPMAFDRARRLGHGLTPDYLISRAHSIRGQRAVLLRSGIIGWNMQQTFFQRRAGLVTLTATTAAGKQGYAVYDVPEEMAIALANEATPDLLTSFLQSTAPIGPQQYR